MLEISEEFLDIYYVINLNPTEILIGLLKEKIKEKVAIRKELLGYWGKKPAR